MVYTPPTSAKPYTLAFPDDAISSLTQLLRLSPIGPATYENQQTEQNYGITQKWLTDTKQYWLDTYNFRAQEKHINSFPNYTMQIEDLNIHFIALFSEKEDAIPIIMMHGWPGSFIEFLPLAGLIRDKYSAKDLPYHIIIPSLPGYTLSSGPPVDKDFSKDDTACIMNKLMTNLGFDKYIAQGGDVGSFVAETMAHEYDACVAVHLNMIVQAEPSEADYAQLTSEEKEHVERSKIWNKTGTGYGLEHGTRPSTIGLVLSSSPLALLAWIGEKFLEWTDSPPPLDTILTNVTLYWLTSSFPRSIYPYRAFYGDEASASKVKPLAYINKPLGVSSFPCEIFPVLKCMAEKKGDLVSFKRHERGGHFAALERPGELWGDVVEFVGRAWKE